VTRDAQLQIFTDILLSASPRDRIEPYLRELVESIEDGEVALEKLATPKGINQHLDEYGWKDHEELNEDDQTPQTEANGGLYRQKAAPTYLGAKYADDYFRWEELGEGSKPRKIPIEKIRGDDFPHVYEYHSYPEDGRPDPPEVNDPVDAIAVEETDRVPDAFVIDYATIIEKSLEDKLEPILETMGMAWRDLLEDGQQSGLDQWT
jgi:DNA polymerase I